MATGLAWAVPSISPVMAMVEELGPVPMKLCRVPEQTCPHSKAKHHPAMVAFGCSPRSNCAALAADWGKWGLQGGKMVCKFDVRLLPFSRHSLLGWLFLKH